MDLVRDEPELDRKTYSAGSLHPYILNKYYGEHTVHLIPLTYGPCTQLAGVPHYGSIMSPLWF